MKTKVTIEEVRGEYNSFPMSEMVPRQICIIQEGCSKGNVCIRGEGTEVWNASDRSFWSDVEEEQTSVKQAPVGTKVIFEVVQ